MGQPIQALVAIYPLLQTDYEGVHRAVRSLQASGVSMKTETTHTTLVGQADEVFEAIRLAFEAASEVGPTTMTVTVTNACSLPTWGEEQNFPDKIR